MSKLNMEGVKAAQGGVLKAGNYIFVIKEWERGKCPENSRTPDCRQYTAYYEVKEPEHLAGRTARDWFVVGTEADPTCRKDETTTDPSNKGAAKLRCVLDYSHTAATNDDEQWMEESIDNEIGVTLRTPPKPDGSGTWFNLTYDYPEAIEVGLDEGGNDKGAKRGGKKGPAQAARAARGRRGTDDDDLGETGTAKSAKGDDDEQNEDDARPPRRRSRRDDDD